MMQFQPLYPILSILGGGFGCILLINRRFGYKISPTEIFHCSLVLGSFILIIPWTFIGIQPDGKLIVFNIELIHFSISFQNYAYLCNGILLLLSFVCDKLLVSNDYDRKYLERRYGYKEAVTVYGAPNF